MAELFDKHGGFRRLHSVTLATIIQIETLRFCRRLTAKRVEARQKNKPAAPECPLCGKPMRPRKSAKGEFWGCSGFPECRGTRPLGPD